jgi:hypothetical protein
MARMSLARVWRRQLYGAWSAALIVPSAMFAALVALALGGGFSQIGVLGQIFAGPPAPAVGGGAGAHAQGGAARSSLVSIPLIPGPSGPSRAPVHAPAGRGGVVPVSTAAPGRAGAAAPIVSQGAGGVAPRPSPTPPAGSAPAGSTPQTPSPSPSPSPSPPPQPTPVDQVVKVVTSVTQQAPAPVGPVATQAVQAAGSAADSLLGQAPSTSQGPALP